MTWHVQRSSQSACRTARAAGRRRTSPRGAPRRCPCRCVQRITRQAVSTASVAPIQASTMPPSGSAPYTPRAAGGGSHAVAVQPLCECGMAGRARDCSQRRTRQPETHVDAGPRPVGTAIAAPTAADTMLTTLGFQSRPTQPPHECWRLLSFDGNACGRTNLDRLSPNVAWSQGCAAPSSPHRAAQG